MNNDSRQTCTLHGDQRMSKNCLNLFSKAENRVTRKQICWGCGNEEGPDEKFQNCAKCVSMNIPPCRFCSKECLTEHWPRHKLWHKETKAHLEDHKKVGIIRMGKPASKEHANEYDKIIAQTQDLLAKLGDKDWVLAEKMYKKAIKLDPVRPDAYFNVGNVYYQCGQKEEAVKYFEDALQRMALIGLTGVNSNSLVKDMLVHQNLWIHVVHALICTYNSLEFDSYKDKPEWFTNDALLMRISKVNLDNALRQQAELDPRKIRTAYILMGDILSGKVHNGRRIDKCLTWTVPPDRTKEELITAAVMYEKSKTFLPAHVIELAAEQAIKICKATAKTRKSSEGNIEKFCYEGLWVVVQGLVKSPHLNDRIGLVSHKGLRNFERLRVKLHGIDEPKLIKPDNLKKVEISEIAEACIACAPEHKKWLYLWSYINTRGEKGMLQFKQFK